jgi:hypothetical protein
MYNYDPNRLMRIAANLTNSIKGMAPAGIRGVVLGVMLLAALIVSSPASAQDAWDNFGQGWNWYDTNDLASIANENDWLNYSYGSDEGRIFGYYGDEGYDRNYGYYTKNWYEENKDRELFDF